MLFNVVLAQVSEYAEHNDAILLVIVPAAQAPEIASSRALKYAKEYDGEGRLFAWFFLGLLLNKTCGILLEYLSDFLLYQVLALPLLID